LEIDCDGVDFDGATEGDAQRESHSIGGSSKGVEVDAASGAGCGLMGCGGTSRRRLMIATEWVVPRIRGGRGAAGFEEGDGFAGGGMAVGWFVRILFLGSGNLAEGCLG
jgi:hypothetical protein